MCRPNDNKRHVQRTISCTCNLTTYQTRKPSYRKDDRAMHPIRECPENFPPKSLTTPRLLFPIFLTGICSDRSCERAYTKFEVRSFTRSWDNRGSQIIGQSVDTPTLPFLQRAFVRMDPVNVRLNLKSVALPVIPEVIAI